MQNNEIINAIFEITNSV